MTTFLTVIAGLFSAVAIGFGAFLTYRGNRMASKAQSEIESRRINKDQLATLVSQYEKDYVRLRKQLERISALLYQSLEYTRELRVAVLDNRRPLPEVPRDLLRLEWFLDEEREPEPAPDPTEDS